jgi:biofilm PGA synthesis N-glycosyltransferase PgaC
MLQKLFGLLIIAALVTGALASGVLLDFIFFYPLFMSFLWIIGGIYFYFHWERNSPGPEVAPAVTEHPFVSIIIPCYNEGMHAAETIDAASRQNWPNYEIIAVNDGSKDDTGAVLDQLAQQHTMLRVVHFAANQGKAMALRMGALVAGGEYLVCIDGDALLHPNATAYLVKPMIDNARVGAVTGNPRIRTRSTLLGKIQVGEFSSIIGLIKRAQRIYGQIFTVSGVIAAFRRRALHQSGYWDLNMVTEDIDVSWQLQLNHWQIQYEPCALAWILMPETLRGLWKQRLRWAQGGSEVFFKNITRIWQWRDKRFWIMVLDFCLSTTWALSYFLSVILWGLGKIIAMPPSLNVPTIWPPAFWGLLLATVGLLQFITALCIESRYDHKLLRSIGWTIWYPFVFWALSLFTTLFGVPHALFAHHEKRAVWSSPDRGFR